MIMLDKESGNNLENKAQPDKHNQDNTPLEFLSNTTDLGENIEQINKNTINKAEEEKIHNLLAKKFTWLACPITKKIPTNPCKVYHKSRCYPITYEYEALIDYYNTHNGCPDKESFTINHPSFAATKFKETQAFKDSPILLIKSGKRADEIHKIINMITSDAETPIYNETTNETITVNYLKSML